jgi:hypothetical protein
LKTVIQGTNNSSYVYNGLGDRLSQTANGATTDFTFDLAAGLIQVLADGTNTYLYGNTRLAQEGAQGRDYFLGDALGSVRQCQKCAVKNGLDFSLSNRYDTHTNQQSLFVRHSRTRVRQFTCFAAPAPKMARI